MRGRGKEVHLLVLGGSQRATFQGHSPHRQERSNRSGAADKILALPKSQRCESRCQIHSLIPVHEQHVPGAPAGPVKECSSNR